MPFVLELPNVWHLATDVEARLVGAGGARRTGPGALALTEVLHPTAAVCGTPRDTAAALIHRLEAEDHGLDPLSSCPADVLRGDEQLTTGREDEEPLPVPGPDRQAAPRVGALPPRAALEVLEGQRLPDVPADDVPS